MAYSTCDDCGTKTYGGRCSNCHEEIFIEEQYQEDGEPVPKMIADMAAKQRMQIESKQ